MTTDHLGSPRVVTDEDGRVTSRRDYTAFGEESMTPERAAGLGYAGQSETRKGYTGYEKDTESGLDFAQARYYNAVHGRYTSVDPLNESGVLANPQTLNRYAYVINDPLSLVDPTGMLPAASSGFSGCSAEYSFGQCGGDAGFWGGGAFGDDVAYRGLTFAGMSPEVAASLDLHLQRISNSIGGNGFVTNQEAFESVVATFPIFYTNYEDGTSGDARFFAGSLVVNQFMPLAWVRAHKLRDISFGVSDTLTFGYGSQAINAVSQYLYGTNLVKTNSREYQEAETVTTVATVVLPGPGGKGKAVNIVFGHGSRHLPAGLVPAAERAITREITAILRSTNQTGSFWGRIKLSGQVLQYRAFTLSDGTINVGTYFFIK